MNMAMTLLSACADNNLGTDTERESVIPEQNQKEDGNAKIFMRNNHVDPI